MGLRAKLTHYPPSSLRCAELCSPNHRTAFLKPASWSQFTKFQALEVRGATGMGTRVHATVFHIFGQKQHLNQI